MDVDFSILNQKGTPAIYADALAARPPAGFAGRLFVDTDSPSTGIYRDTGTAWILISDPGGAVTPTLAQVTAAGATTLTPVTFGDTVPPTNSQLNAIQKGTYTGIEWANFYAQQDQTFNGASIIINGPAYAAVTAQKINRLTGSVNLPNGVSAWSPFYAVSEFDLGGNTLTQQQSGGARLVTNIKTQTVLTGTPGTITHFANLWLSPFYDPTLGAYNGTINNAYHIYLSNMTEQAGSLVFTNRYGLYQASSAEPNVLLSNTSIGSAVLTGYMLNVEGSLRVLGNTYFVASAGARVGIGTDTPTNALHVVGSARATTGFSANDGTAGSPSFYFTADTDTGIFREGANAICVSTAGVTRMRIANQNIGINTVSGNAPSTIFQIDSTTQGVLLPRMTTAQINAIPSPPEGLLVYNTTLSHLCCYQAGAWAKFSHSPM